MQRANKKYEYAFILLLIGGAFIFLGGLVSSMLSLFGMWMGGMMAYTQVYLLGGFVVSAFIGLILGLFIMAASFQVRSGGKKAQNYAIAALIASVLSLLNLGGLFIGFLLSLIGAIFALS